MFISDNRLVFECDECTKWFGDMLNYLIIVVVKTLWCFVYIALINTSWKAFVKLQQVPTPHQTVPNAYLLLNFV